MDIGGVILHSLFTHSFTCEEGCKRYTMEVASPTRPGDRLATSVWRMMAIKGLDEIWLITRDQDVKLVLNNRKAHSFPNVHHVFILVLMSWLRVAGGVEVVVFYFSSVQRSQSRHNWFKYAIVDRKKDPDKSLIVCSTVPTRVIHFRPFIHPLILHTSLLGHHGIAIFRNYPHLRETRRKCASCRSRPSWACYLPETCAAGIVVDVAEKESRLGEEPCAVA